MVLEQIFRFANVYRLYSRESFPSDSKGCRLHTNSQKRALSVLTNYRPISVTPFFSKVLGTVLLSRLVEFTENEPCLNRAIQLTVLLLIEINRKYDSYDTGDVFLDLAKTFYSILHKVSKKKLIFSISQSTIFVPKSLTIQTLRKIGYLLI